jgi:hypothetical protein
MEIFHDVYSPKDSVCMTTISPLDIFQKGQGNLFILGDSFMQLYYSIFDRDNDMVGLAKSKINEREMTKTKISIQKSTEE